MMTADDQPCYQVKIGARAGDGSPETLEYDGHWFDRRETTEALTKLLAEARLGLENYRLTFKRIEEDEHASVEALRPFAAAADRYDVTSADNVELWQNGKRVDYITVGDLRKAARALAALQAKPSSVEGGV
jgi:hypothetical protein